MSRPRLSGPPLAVAKCAICHVECGNVFCDYCAGHALRMRAEADAEDDAPRCVVCGRPARGRRLEERFCERHAEAGNRLYYAARQRLHRKSKKVAESA